MTDDFAMPCPAPTFRKPPYPTCNGTHNRHFARAPSNRLTGFQTQSEPTWFTRIGDVSGNTSAACTAFLAREHTPVSAAKVRLMPMEDRLVWVDCEMTGLDLVNDALIEVACVVTDSELKELDAGITVVIKPPAPALEQMNDFVRNMHTESGLLPLLDDGMTMEQAQQEVLDYIKSHVDEPLKAPLCGSSVYVDRGYLARDMPEVDAYLHYRLVDVSSFKEMIRRWYPKVYYASPDKHGGHRALADIRESIAELRYYRETVLVGQPGPDSTTARGIAKRFELAPDLP